MWGLLSAYVSATRTEQSKKDSSSSIETVSADELEANLASDLKEVFKYTPGVEAQGSGRFGIGGFNIRHTSNDGCFTLLKRIDSKLLTILILNKRNHLFDDIN